MSVLIALAAALASACGFAFSTSLQHRVAGTAPPSVRGSAQLLRYLVTKPLWVVGFLLSGGALVFHAFALHLAPIALVQPIMIGGVVLAVLVRAGLDRRLPSANEVIAVSVTALGIVAFVVTTDPTDTNSSIHGRDGIVLTLACLVVAGGVAAGASRLRSRNRQALSLGACVGVLFGLTAGLTKIVAGQFASDGIENALLSWPIYALVVAGAFAIVVNQRAYRIAPLSMSLPMINVVDVAGAVLFGLVVLGEVPAHNPLAVATQAAAVVAMLVGLWLIARAASKRVKTRAGAT
ncbi:MAG: DMT family transporter [Streptosporangiales bacterium]